MLDEDTKREVLKLVQDVFQEFINQHNIPPDMVKERHMGEGIRFIRAGLVANRPTTPERDGAVYFALDENKLYVGDTGAWLEETFT